MAPKDRLKKIDNCFNYIYSNINIIKYFVTIKTRNIIIVRLKYDIFYNVKNFIYILKIFNKSECFNIKYQPDICKYINYLIEYSLKLNMILEILDNNESIIFKDTLKLLEYNIKNNIYKFIRTIY